MTLKKIRKDNYPEWYQCVVNEADMAENSSSPGCMVIKPWGYGIWERIRDVFDEKTNLPITKTAIFRCLFHCRSFKKKPNTLTVLPKKWPWLLIRGCQ